MRTKNPHRAGAYVDHGDASVLFPVDSLAAPVLQHRDAELALEAASSDEVVAVAPTGLASSYFLTRHPLSVVETGDLHPETRATLEERADLDVDDYRYVRIGRGPTRSENHSLREY